jgi:hypothetical protein
MHIFTKHTSSVTNKRTRIWDTIVNYQSHMVSTTLRCVSSLHKFAGFHGNDCSYCSLLSSDTYISEENAVTNLRVEGIGPTLK